MSFSKEKGHLRKSQRRTRISEGYVIIKNKNKEINTHVNTDIKKFEQNILQTTTEQQSFYLMSHLQ